MGLTLQGLMTFIISMVLSIIICTRFEKIKNIGPYFFVAGMITCFFDLFTHPIITLGIPLIIFMLLKQEKENMSLKEAIKIIIINSILWGIGYILTNFMKWIIVDICYQRNLITIALEQLLFRSQESVSTEYTFLKAVADNVKSAGIRPIIFITIIAIYTVLCLIRNYKSICIEWKKALPYLIISLMPIAWFMLMKNHDIEHSYFTYRGLVVFYIGIGIALVKLFNKKNSVDASNNSVSNGADRNTALEQERK